jgi:Homeodomain-like domain
MHQNATPKQATARAIYEEPCRVEVRRGGLETVHVFEQRENGTRAFNELRIPHATPDTLRQLADQFESRQAIAYELMAGDSPDSFVRARAHLEALRYEGQGRAGLPTAFLEGIAHEYEQLPARGRVAKLAERHGVNRSTASRWVQRARQEGLLS